MPFPHQKKKKLPKNHQRKAVQAKPQNEWSVKRLHKQTLVQA